MNYLRIPSLLSVVCNFIKKITTLYVTWKNLFSTYFYISEIHTDYFLSLCAFLFLKRNLLWGQVYIVLPNVTHFSTVLKKPSHYNSETYQQSIYQ